MSTFDRIAAGVMGILVAVIAVEAALGDRAGAGIARIAPANGSTPATTTTIQIEFNQPMDQASIETRLTVSPAAPGKVRWSGTTLFYAPGEPLRAGQRYQVTLAAGGRSLLGRPVTQSRAWSFTPRAPGVAYLAPADAEVRALWTASLDGGAPHELYHAARGIDSFAVSPDGSQIAVVVNGHGEAADIWLVDPWSGNAARIIKCAPDYCGGVSWSPDGQRFAFERRQSDSASEGAASRVWLYDVLRAATTPVFQDRSRPAFGPRWSPDGSRIAVFDPQVQAIDVVDLSSGTVLYLPSQMGEVGSFSPDGSRIAFADIRPVGNQVFPELWLGDLTADNRITELFAQAEEDQFPAWSPDGRWIAFGRRRLDRRGGFGSQMMLASPVTGEVRQITNDPAFNNTAFAWKPSGDALLVQRFDMQSAPGGSSIWMYDIQTGNLTAVASNGYGAAWLP